MCLLQAECVINQVASYKLSVVLQVYCILKAKTQKWVSILELPEVSVNLLKIIHFSSFDLDCVFQKYH